MSKSIPLGIKAKWPGVCEFSTKSGMKKHYSRGHKDHLHGCDSSVWCHIIHKEHSTGNHLLMVTSAALDPAMWPTPELSPSAMTPWKLKFCGFFCCCCCCFSFQQLWKGPEVFLVSWAVIRAHLPNRYILVLKAFSCKHKSSLCPKLWMHSLC